MNKEVYTVLCIDDEKMIRLSIGDYLEDSGYVMHKAENGRIGLEMLRENLPDIILVDLRMPEVDGLEVLATVRKESPETPVIVVSGTGVIKDVVEALHLGAWDYITKPIEDMGMLEHAIERCLERAQLIQENKAYKENLEKLVLQRTEELRQSEERYRLLNVELEERVKKRTTDLEAANKELQNFAQIVSHDLKAPLRGINQLACWLIEDYAEAFGEEGKKMVHLLIGRVKRMDNLIDGILQYSRAGRIKGKVEHIALNTLVRDIAEMLAPPENIHIHIKDVLPVVIGDTTQITQVFQNLLSNAVKYIDTSEGDITVHCVDEGEHWTFSVVDNGPGIDPKHHEKIFQIFQTLAPRDERESTGIGLSLVKKIVELHGGRVWVESGKGLGSTFYFTLKKRWGRNIK